MSLATSFVLKLKEVKGLTGMVYGHVFFHHCYGSIKLQTSGVINRGKWMNVGNDGMNKAVSLYLIYSYILPS